MKIVCDNCATKYSIADEKVRGKVFKIRCKKCSHIIVVRGGADGSVEASSSRDAGPADGGFPGGGGEEQQTIAARGATGGEASGDAVWHLVIDREQVGPLSPSEVRAKFAGGEVDAETYAWREGFGDWLRLGSIEDFRDLGGDAPAAPDAGATRRTDSADLFAGAGGGDEASDAPAGDLFGGGAQAPAYSSAPAPAAASSHEDVFGNGGGGALFSAPSAAPAPARQSRTSSPSFASSSASAESSSSSHGNGNVVDVRPMTGQRNENSVLFSLNNLQALATGGAGGGKSGQSGGGGSSENRPGFANSQTEGSGLIDIRAMAASTLAASPSTGGGLGSGPGELPGLGAAPVFSPMAAPILMPSAPSGPPNWMWAILGVGGLAVIGIVVVGALLLTRKPAELTVAQPPVAAAPVAAAPAATTAAKPTAAAPAAPVAAATPSAAAATPAADKHAAKAPKGEKVAKVAKNEPAKAAAEAPAAAAPVAAAAPAPKRSGKRDELDDLLNNASPGETPKQHKAAAAAAADTGGGASDDSLPDTLDKGQIVSGMSKVKGRVQGCFDQFKVPGTANVAITIANSGHVSSANVTGQFAGTPTGECVAKAVKTAGFSKFKGSPMSFVYPYLLR